MGQDYMYTNNRSIDKLNIYTMGMMRLCAAKYFLFLLHTHPTPTRMLPLLLCLAGRTQGAAAFGYVDLMMKHFPCNGVRSLPAVAWTRTFHRAPCRCSAAAPRSMTTAAAASFVAADRPPARAGDRIADVDTPALLVDLDGAGGGAEGGGG
jgi:hypothetical protein